MKKNCLLLPDLEWKIIYVGSAESEEYDQVLDSVLVGPVPAGRHMFVFQVSEFGRNLISSLTLPRGRRNIDVCLLCVCV